MKITSGEVTNDKWYASAVGTNDIMWGSSDETNYSVTLDNCTFSGSGTGFGFMPLRSKFVVNNCRFNNYDQAIYFACDGMETRDCQITNNTMTNCTFAIHGYYGGTKALDLVSPMVISGNTIQGTAERYSVIAVMDQPNGSGSDKGSIKLDIHDNTFSYTIVGGINMQQDGDVVQGSMADVRNVNTFENYSYVADAYWYTASQYGTTYYVESPDGKIATWFANPTSEAANSPERLEAIKQALEEHGTAGDVIEISSEEYNQEMFTIAKNAMAIEAFVDAGDLKIEKQVVGNENDDKEFSFTVTFTRENGKQLNGVYDVTYSDGTTAAIKLEGGAYTFKLKNGESIVIEDLLPGTNYVITENLSTDYTTLEKNAVGVIPEAEDGVVKTTEVIFTNTKVSTSEGEDKEIDWSHSKSKTATNLDKNYDSAVTLSLPSASYEGNLDVAFVLDGSTSADEDDLTAQAAELLDELAAMENINTKVSLTVFGGSVPILENTGLLSISNESDLEMLKDKLTDPKYDKMAGRSGSNLQAGVEAARTILNADDSVEASDKYLIILSDGEARMWYENGEALSQTYEFKAELNSNQSSVAWNNNCDFLDFRYSESNYPDFEEDVWNVGQSGVTIGNYAMNKMQMEAAKVGDEGVASNEIVRDSESEYFTTYEAATYYAATSIIDAKDEANVILVTYPYHDETFYGKYIESFKAWLNKQGISRYDNKAVSESDIFDSIKNDLIQVVDAGSKVVDVIGYGKDNKGNAYDFQFVNSDTELTLTVAGKELPVTCIDNTTYGFGAEDGSESEEFAKPTVSYEVDRQGNISNDEDSSPETVKTGDSANITLWCLLLLASCICMAIVVICKKCRKSMGR